MVSDPTLFLQRVMEQTLAKSPRLVASLVGRDRNTSEDLFADILSDRLAALIEPDQAGESDGSEGSNSNFSRDLLAAYEELVERNRVLADALGACDCWGEQADCDVCHGAGGPGWAFPDSRLFAILVRPAMGRLRASPRGEGMQVMRNLKGARR